MSELARALLGELEPEDLRMLAERLEPYLPDSPPVGDEWMDSKATAAYLQISMPTLRRYIGAHKIPFHQERPSARCYFRRSELDAWRRETCKPTAV